MFTDYERGRAVKDHRHQRAILREGVDCSSLQNKKEHLCSGTPLTFILSDLSPLLHNQFPGKDPAAVPALYLINAGRKPM